MPSVDPESARMIREALAALEGHLRACVVAVRRDDPRSMPSSPATARLLLAALVGISSMSRAGAPRRALADVARAALSIV
jgi:hypothetical protein